MSEKGWQDTWTIWYRPASSMPTIKMGPTTIKGHHYPGAWLAISAGGSFRFETEEAAQEFASSDRAKAVNPGPKPLIDEHLPESIDIAAAKLSTGRIARKNLKALRTENAHLRPSSSFRTGIDEAVLLLTSTNLCEDTARTTKAARTAWAARAGELLTTEDRDHRIGFLFAGLTLAGQKSAFRYRKL